MTAKSERDAARMEREAITGVSREVYRPRRRMSELDAAVLAYRTDPSAENRERLMAAQRAHVDRFYARQAAEFIRRTSGSTDAR